MGLVIAGMFVRNWRVRNLDRRTTEAQDLALLRNHPLSLRRAWDLLPHVAAMPSLHGRTVALIAMNLDQLSEYDSALVAYDELIDRLPEQHPASVQFRINRVILHLFTDRLIDADDELRRLRGLVERFARTAVSAGYRLAELVQSVRTNHFADAVVHADSLVTDLRPLGIEAGYGHALMALSFHQLATAGDDAAARQTSRWWRRATILLPVPQLVRRFAELEPLARDERLRRAAQSTTPPTEAGAGPAAMPGTNPGANLGAAPGANPGAGEDAS
jgi:hypothetical protein